LVGATGVYDDIFDDVAVRCAFEHSLGMRARPIGGKSGSPGWAFEGRRYGLRRVELCPYGLYSAVSASQMQFDEFLEFVDGARRSEVVNVRINVNPLEARAEAIARHAIACGYQMVQNQTHILPIGTSIDALRNEYHATKRHQVLRKVKARSSIVVANSASQLEDYFAVYCASLERWGRDGFVYPRALFTSLLGCPSVRIWMNYVEGRLACAMVVFYSRTYALYWQGVSRIDVDQKHAFPMVKLMDAVLQDLVLSGIPQFNLGASDGLPNVRRFKEEFGARPITYPTLTYVSKIWRVLYQAHALWRGASA
jgi:hypothetical protein